MITSSTPAFVAPTNVRIVRVTGRDDGQPEDEMSGRSVTAAAC